MLCAPLNLQSCAQLSMSGVEDEISRSKRPKIVWQAPARLPPVTELPRALSKSSENAGGHPPGSEANGTPHSSAEAPQEAGSKASPGSNLGKRKHPDAELSVARELAQRDGTRRQTSSAAGTGATPAVGTTQSASVKAVAAQLEAQRRQRQQPPGHAQPAAGTPAGDAASPRRTPLRWQRGGLAVPPAAGRGRSFKWERDQGSPAGTPSTGSLKSERDRTSPAGTPTADRSEQPAQPHPLRQQQRSFKWERGQQPALGDGAGELKIAGADLSAAHTAPRQHPQAAQQSSRAPVASSSSRPKDAGAAPPALAGEQRADIELREPGRPDAGRSSAARSRSRWGPDKEHVRDGRRPGASGGGSGMNARQGGDSAARHTGEQELPGPPLGRLGRPGRGQEPAQPAERRDARPLSREPESRPRGRPRSRSPPDGARHLPVGGLDGHMGSLGPERGREGPPWPPHGMAGFRGDRDHSPGPGRGREGPPWPPHGREGFRGDRDHSPGPGRGRGPPPGREGFRGGRDHSPGPGRGREGPPWPPHGREGFRGGRDHSPGPGRGREGPPWPPHGREGFRGGRDHSPGPGRGKEGPRGPAWERDAPPGFSGGSFGPGSGRNGPRDGPRDGPRGPQWPPREVARARDGPWPDPYGYGPDRGQGLGPGRGPERQDRRREGSRSRSPQDWRRDRVCSPGRLRSPDRRSLPQRSRRPVDQPQQRRSSPSHSRSHSRDHNGRGAQAATGYQPPALPAAPGAQIASNSADAAAAVMQMQGLPPGHSGLTADQKRKKLWGGGSAATAQPQAAAPVAPVSATFGANKWDTASFDNASDADKFARLMGAKKGPTTMGPLPQDEADIPREVPRRNRQQHMLSELEHQYYAGIRRKDGRTVGLGL